MPLAWLLPNVKVSVRGSNASDWFETSLRYALAEARSSRLGRQGVPATLDEMLSLEVLRIRKNERAEAGHLTL